MTFDATNRGVINDPFSLMESKLLDTILDRLETDRDALPAGTDDLILAACLDDGKAQVEAALGGASPTAPQADPAEAPPPPVHAWVRSINVQGFRGIGPNARLDLTPGPGLTLVVGRNGSGKSSFAEAFETLLTGGSYRWSSKKSKIWQEGWRNLHQHSTELHAELVIEGRGGKTLVERTWPTVEPSASGKPPALIDGVASLQERGAAKRPLRELGWDEPLATWRPFLSYDELGSLLDEGPSRLFDALGAILGLEELGDAAEHLRQAKLQRDRAAREVTKDLKALLARLKTFASAAGDERATVCIEALDSRKRDLDRVESLLAGGAGAPDPADPGSEVTEQRHLQGLSRVAGPDSQTTIDLALSLQQAQAVFKKLQATEVARGRRVAHLLREAIDLHRNEGDQLCPVCKRGRLDDAWLSEAETTADELEQQARALHDAEQHFEQQRAAIRTLLRTTAPLLDGLDLLESSGTGGSGLEPAVLTEAREAATAWRDLLPLTAPAGGPGKPGEPAAPVDLGDRTLATELPKRAKRLRDALDPIRQAAAARLSDREDNWRPFARELNAWLPRARKVEQEKARVALLRKAETWLRNVTTAIQNERFEPIRDRVKDLWSTLRTRSHVDLEDIAFAGSLTRRRVDLEVTVDGTEGAALGVMSQGELHALALCLFLPRATDDGSPFRFLFIDDPVQSMDPARVEGLARALQQVATCRQVVVFTHDDRLPDAIRRLEIEATVLEVQRDQGSRVAVRRSLHPVDRYLDDARALARTPDLPAGVAERVIPGLCRQALEAACLEVLRCRRLAKGISHLEIEELLADHPKLIPRLALALFDDPDRSGEVMAKVNSRWDHRVGDAIQACNKGAHGHAVRADDSLINTIERIAKDLVNTQ